jgi:hypothetical protein
MKKHLLTAFLMALIIYLKAQTMTVEQVVQQNLEAYNARDLDKFMSSFSEDIEMYNFTDGKMTAKGLSEVRKIYQELFNLSPQLHSTILKRIVFDNKIIDHEWIEGRRGSKTPVEIILIYEVKNEKIFKTTAIRKQE